MFKDVPGELTQALQRLPEGMKAPDVRHLAAGSLVTAHYLRNAEPLRRCGMLPDGDLEREDAARLVQIGDLLFTLRTEPGFTPLCRRLGQAPLSTALFELTVAAMFARAGFRVHARPDSLSRYEYSFRAIATGTAVNVAALAFGAKYRRDRVLTELWRRRRRLPDDLPGVVLCLYPASWRKDAWDLDFELAALAGIVLAEARRFNYLFFAEERFTPVEGGGVIATTGFAARNMAARLPCPMLDAAILPEGTPALAAAPVMTVPCRLDEGAFGCGDFDQWVNWAAAR